MRQQTRKYTTSTSKNNQQGIQSMVVNHHHQQQATTTTKIKIETTKGVPNTNESSNPTNTFKTTTETKP